MLKSRKKGFSVLLAVILVWGLLLGGCGETPPLSQTEASDSQPSTQITPSETQPTTQAETQQETTPPYTLPQGSELKVRFLDVGQADAALVSCDNHHMLIDGGNRGDSNLIYSVLQREEISYLDMVVATHAHEDHIGGLPGAFQYASAGLTLSPVTQYDSGVFEDFAAKAQEKGGGLTVPQPGDTYSLGSATVTILGVNGAEDTNNTSIVLRIDYGETAFLFTGDAEREAEQVILDSGLPLSATVLKVGHHGSDTSTTYPFLREIMPQYAVISVGTGNSYGHPCEDTLSKLRDADVQVFRTDMQGDIVCISDGKTVTVKTRKNQNANTLGPSQPTETTQPSQTTQPTEATQPSQTTQPTEATQPSQTTQPTEATQPSQTTQPTEATQPTESSAQKGISVIAWPHTTGRNETATVTIQGLPNTPYTITVYYKSGPSSAAGLEEKTSDSSGLVSWSWKVGGRTSPGTFSITVSGGGETLTLPFTVSQ